MERESRRSVRHGYGLAVATGCALALAVAGCEEKNAYVPPPPPKVTVAQPLQHPVTVYFSLTGNTQAVNNVTLNARVQGYVEQIRYKDGAKVAKGDPLFVIEKDTYQAALDQATANLAAEQAGQLQAQQQYTRQSTLGKDSFASVAAVEDAKAKLDQANAAVAGAKANLETATINLGFTDVKAPFDGVVTNHLVDIGALVGVSGPTQLASIVQLDPINVYFNVSEDQVLQIKRLLAKRGLTSVDVASVPVEVGLQSEEGYPHRGHLDYVSPTLDPATGTLTVRGVLENKDRALLPGLFVRVRVPVQKQESATLVADTAISTGQAGAYVFVLGKDDVVEQRPVAVGPLQDGGLRVIETGLTSEDWVIVSGIQRAIPGGRVAPEKVAMPQSGSAAPAGSAAPPDTPKPEVPKAEAPKQ